MKWEAEKNLAKVDINSLIKCPIRTFTVNSVNSQQQKFNTILPQDVRSSRTSPTSPKGEEE